MVVKILPIMSFIIERKKGNSIYLYKITSYWNKEEKKKKQKTEYIGKKEEEKSEIDIFSTDFRVKNFGNIFFLEHLSEKIGLTSILKSVFVDDYREILALAYYFICEPNPGYLFHYWLEEQNLEGIKKLNSSGVSALYHEIGQNGKNMMFLNQWINSLNPKDAIYYDVTSISSYSMLNEMVEDGYNRDGEKLPQINLGLVFSRKHSLPVYYHSYQGSITDVSTLDNCIKHLKLSEIEDITFVLDRGFFSKTNLALLCDKDRNFKFLQPVPMTVNAAKEVLYNNRKLLKETHNAFSYNDTILYHYNTDLTYDKKTYAAHVFFNEITYAEQKNRFISEILNIDKQLNIQQFEQQKDFLQYRNEIIIASYRKFFKWNRQAQKAEINTAEINKHISKLGSFVMISNLETLEKSDVLEYYRNKDLIEKVFDILKNEIDGDRLKTQSNINSRGKLFVQFIALILYSEIAKTMKQKELYKILTFKELIMELKKIKLTIVKKDKKITSIISKKQNKIMEAFSLHNLLKHGDQSNLPV